ncbi:MAG: phospholipase D-like domain-containing protein [Planctomycetota bacterium]
MLRRRLQLHGSHGSRRHHRPLPKDLLHTKSITIDGRVSFFGTVNIDMRSLWLNSEVTLLVYDRGFTAELRRVLMGYLDRSIQLDLDRWLERPALKRFLESAARFLGPVL